MSLYKQAVYVSGYIFLFFFFLTFFEGGRLCLPHPSRRLTESKQTTFTQFDFK